MPPQWDREAMLANPMLESLRTVLPLCPADRFPSPDELSALARERAVTSGGGAALRFIPAGAAAARDFNSQYEVRIFREGLVPTRPGNFHDAFNALAWFALPRTKAVLNRRHFEEITARKDIEFRGTGRKDIGSRGTARDVLTLFDEGGVILACGAPELARLLREFSWKTLFWTRRAEVMRSMRFLVFGHAIHEKALQPYKGLTAKALVVDVANEFFGVDLDAQLAEADALAARYFGTPSALASTRTLGPLPILGVPGWAPENERESFYEDVVPAGENPKTESPGGAIRFA